FQAEDGIRDRNVTGVETCALPIFLKNEQPIPGCKDCAILRYQLQDYRNKWNKRPSEYRWQDLFEGAQDAFLEHWHTHEADMVQEIGRASSRERVERRDEEGLRKAK